MKHSRPNTYLSALALATLPFVAHNSAAQSAEEMAKKMANPIAAVISVPFQFNFDKDIGPNRDGKRTTVNLQPVIPVSLNEDWNIISRTIVPLVKQDLPGVGDGSQSGVGDVVQNLFFSPKQPTANGVIWGAGPVALIPSGNDKISADSPDTGAHGWAFRTTLTFLFMK